MVNVTKGILVECDPAMKQVLLSIHRDFNPFFTFQFLLHLDEKFTLGSKFIIQVTSSISCQSPKNICFQDLDETHLFISPDVLEQLKAQIDDLMDKISVPIVEGVEKK